MYLIDLLKHDFMAKTQSQFLKDSNESFEAGAFIIHFDFATNYCSSRCGLF